MSAELRGGLRTHDHSLNVVEEVAGTRLAYRWIYDEIKGGRSKDARVIQP